MAFSNFCVYSFCGSYAACKVLSHKTKKTNNSEKIISYNFSCTSGYVPLTHSVFQQCQKFGQSYIFCHHPVRYVLCDGTNRRCTLQLGAPHNTTIVTALIRPAIGTTQNISKLKEAAAPARSEQTYQALPNSCQCEALPLTLGH